MREGTYTISSRLAAPAGAVWARVTTPAGINDELRPLLKMLPPRNAPDGLNIDNVPVGSTIGRCWILAFGVLPVDYDDLRLERVEPGRGFLERSRTSSQRLWEHERRVEPDGDGCVLTDRLRWQPRGPLPPGVLAPVFRAIFRHRHRRLRRRFRVAKGV